MTDLRSAIEARMAEQQKPAPTFEPNPDLEEWGRKLDALAEHDPAEYAHPGLDAIRTQVATYRRRKATHKENR